MKSALRLPNIFEKQSQLAEVRENPKNVLKTRHLFIHIAYWMVAAGAFIMGYSIIGLVWQGFIYAGIGLPLMMTVTYLFIYWTVPSLLFKDRRVMFTLVTATIFAAVLNILIVIVLAQRIFFAADPTAEIAFVHLDIIYLMVATILLSLPAISYETLRHWKETNSELSKL
jgi:hypothetical protein